jgi:hypothetical protein
VCYRNRLGRCDWMNLAWVRDEWRAVVGKEINVGFS